MKLKLLFSFLIGCVFMGFLFYIIHPEIFIWNKASEDLIIIPKQGVDSLSFDLETGNYLLWNNGGIDTLKIK
ncbi:MAG: hypothetical protein ABIP51_22600 [Bacteroidia bacterium]